MKDTERFDEWVRNRVDELDEAPVTDERRVALWQKMQAEMPPVHQPARSRAWWPYAAAAAVTLLLVATWLLTNEQPVHQQPNSRLSAVPVVPDEKITPLTTAPKPKQSEEIRPSDMALSGRNQKPVARPAKAVIIEQTVVEPTTPLIASTPTETPPVEIPVIAQATPPAPETAPTAPMKRPMPKKAAFKIVHANELTQYQRSELAEATDREFERQGFVVIRFNKNPNSSERTLLTHLRERNKNKTD